MTSSPIAETNSEATTTTTTTTTTTVLVADSCDGVHEHWHPVTNPGPKAWWVLQTETEFYLLFNLKLFTLLLILKKLKWPGRLSETVGQPV